MVRYVSRKGSHITVRRCSRPFAAVHHTIETAPETFIEGMLTFADGRLQPGKLTVSMTAFLASSSYGTALEIPSCH
jgi:hypothetical protein